MRLLTLKSASPDPSPELQTHVSKCRLDTSPECSMNTSYCHVHNSTPFLPHQTPPFSTKSSTINSVCYIRKQDAGTSLAVQWLRLWASTAGDMNSIRGRGIKLLNDVQHNKQKANRTSPISLHGPLPPSLYIQLLTFSCIHMLLCVDKFKALFCPGLLSWRTQPASRSSCCHKFSPPTHPL